MTEMWKKDLDGQNVVGEVVRDLSKSFDCLLHDLLIAKSHAYSFEKSTLNFILDYLPDRTQQIKRDGECTEYRTMRHCIPQGSISRLLLFNLFF